MMQTTWPYYIFRPLNSNIIVDKLFSCVVNSWRKESQAEENKYLIWTADWGGEHSTPRNTEYTYTFLSAIAVMQVIFWTEDNFCFNSDCGNLFKFNCKLKKLINELIVIFYSPSNALCSCDESLQIKHFKHHTFIGMLSPWFNLQIMNFSLWRHVKS